jgi:hypothetical protein
MRFEMTGEGDNRTCVAVATEKSTGERVESPPVSIEMAKAEGWFGKAGSKWKTMPELMLRYRAATLFGRLYAPEILMGMRSAEELEDIEEATTVQPARRGKAADIASRFADPPETVTAQDVEPAPENTTDPAIAPESNQNLQAVFAALQNLFETTGEMPDDILDRISKGRYGCQTDLMDASGSVLSDLLASIQKEAA